MPEKFKYIILLLICISGQIAFAQSPTNPNNPTYPGQQRKPNFNDTTTSKPETADQQLDSLRKKMDRRKDSVVFNSKFIRVTTEKLLRDSTQLFRLDTSVVNFENYSPLLQPRDPRISLGYTGEPQRSLLFSPSKTIGFDAGLHELDPYLLNPDGINYYRARVPLTILDFVTGGHKEQILKVTHTQNVNPQLNVGFNLNFTGSQGYYGSALLGQNVSNVNAAFFSWYESKNKRYNLLTNLIYNNLKSPITGSILSNDTIFVEKNPLATTDEISRLPNTYEQWTGTSFYLKQFYYIGRIDSLKKKGTSSSILPTQRVAYTFFVETKNYNFRQNDADTYNVFPDYYFDSNYARDSTTVHHLQNSFSYSFYLRSKGDKPVKNEAKLDLGLTQDIYSYNQYVRDTTLNQYGSKVNLPVKQQSSSFQDITLTGKISYRFSDRLLLEGNVQQIAAGRDFGNFLYDAKLTLAGGGKVGKIVFEGYTQSSAPPLVYTDWVSDHFIFHNKFNNQKTNSISFNYINDALRFDLKAEYFLIGDYLYFAAQPNGIDAHPVQLGSDINLLKVSLGKSLSYRHWHFDTYAVYQKTDYQATLRTPEFYNYSSLYYKGMYFDVLNTSIGIDVRYNTQYVVPSYAPGLGQFYNGPNVTFSSFPVATLFLKATLQHTNFFIMYDYANQGLLSKGYYTVYKYPQQDHLLKFGVSWAFYN